MSNRKPLNETQTSAIDLAKRFKYAIESGVPISETRPHKKGNNNKGPERLLYPLKLMDIGQSFFVPAADFIGRLGWSSINCAINVIQQREDKRFCWRTRTLTDHGEEGWRVWRIK